MIPPEVVLPLLCKILQGRKEESFVVVILNVHAQVTAWCEIARGSTKAVEVSVREFFRTALMLDAAGVLIAHNHPSGDPTPSAEDVVLTAKLTKAGDLIGCPIVDHIIIGGGDRFYSFASKDSA